MKNIGTNIYKIRKYILSKSIFLSIQDKKHVKILIYVRRKLYIVENLRVNSNDIIVPEILSIYSTNKKAVIYSYNYSNIYISILDYYFTY